MKEPKIKLHPVVSSNISAAGYDAATKTLDIVFSNGATYRYDNVPPGKVRAMWEADSVGKYVAKNIAHSYPFRKV